MDDHSAGIRNSSSHSSSTPTRGINRPQHLRRTPGGLQSAARRFQLSVQHQWNSNLNPLSSHSSHLDFDIEAEQINNATHLEAGKEQHQHQLYSGDTKSKADETDNDVNSETVLLSSTNINIDQALQSLYDYKY
jgi:hypothetical protein